MGRKPLIILVAAAVILLVLYVALREREVPRQAGPQTVPLLDAVLSADSVASVRIHARGTEALLVREDSGWRLKNLANAPVFEEWVNQIVRSLLEARGEVRGRSADLFDDFRIGDDEGVHLEMAGWDGTQVLHLIVGKPTSDWRGSFVRKEGEETVYLVRANLRSILRLRGSVEEPEVEPSAWADMEMVPFQSNELGLVEVEGPDGGFTLVYEEPLGIEGESPPAPRWVLRSPEGAPFDEEKLRRLANGAASLRAQKVADLQDAAAAGLEAAERRIRAEAKTGESVTVLVGGEVEGDEGARYGRVAANETIYVLPRYALESLFQTVDELAPDPEEEPEEG
jgi:hypothetical protein